ncbi:MAG TPA: flagellar hook-basal body protein [Bacillales bacterium]|nr:flagellar hook-basal body protein [Bacillales bacterium]
MNPSMITAAATMGQLQKKIDTIGHNLANLNTYGYKAREVRFSSLLFQQVDNLPREDEEEARLTPDGIRLGYGAGIGETNVNMARGTLQQTGRALDVALLDAYQFFQIEPAGDGGPAVTYTRDGAFYLQPDAGNPDLLNLVTKDGDFVLGAGGRIQIPADYETIAINGRGEIEVTLGDGRHLQAGRLSLARILRPQLLHSMGDNQFAFPELDALNLQEADVVQPVAVNEASVSQGALESSNVDLVTQMTQLMNTQRAYQFNARAVTLSDQTMRAINNIR